MLDTVCDRWLEAQMRSAAVLLYVQALAAMSRELESFLLSGAFPRDLDVAVVSARAAERRWTVR